MQINSAAVGGGTVLPIDISVTGGGTIRLHLSGGVSIGDSTDPGINWTRVSNKLAVSATVVTNGFQTSGVTIDQSTAADQLLSMKSTGSVAHGMTTLTDTATYGVNAKVSGAGGGLWVRGFSSGIIGLYLQGNHTTDSAAHTVAGSAAIYMEGNLKSGTTTGALTANANILAVASNGSAKFLVDVEGDLFADGSAPTIYDSYDDVALVRTHDLFTARAKHAAGILLSSGDAFIKYNEDTLVSLGILGAPLADGGLTNITRLQRLHSGAIWQLGERLVAQETEIKDLRARLSLVGG
jgi:hypothetical protein